MPKPTIDSDKCQHCNVCIEMCPVNVFKKNGNGDTVIDVPDECIGCRSCEAQCPKAAITVHG
jgi:NAD-dependent dihydropyrimidine dehydrogenase PreA subunit